MCVNVYISPVAFLTSPPRAASARRTRSKEPLGGKVLMNGSKDSDVGWRDERESHWIGHVEMFRLQANAFCLSNAVFNVTVKQKMEHL